VNTAGGFITFWAYDDFRERHLSEVRQLPRWAALMPHATLRVPTLARIVRSYDAPKILMLASASVWVSVSHAYVLRML
jgi:hypothetical protein